MDAQTSAFQAIARIHRLVDEDNAEVAGHPELNQKLYIGSLENIETGVTSTPLNGQWVQYIAHFHGSNAIALELVADHFDRW